MLEGLALVIFEEYFGLFKRDRVTFLVLLRVRRVDINSHHIWIEELRSCGENCLSYGLIVVQKF